MMIRYTIDTHEELQTGVIRVMEEQLNAISNQCDIPETIDITVHKIRKHCRRIRALLRIIRYDIGETSFLYQNAKYKEIAIKLAKARDLNVVIAYLAECFEAEEININEEEFISFIEHLSSIKEAEIKLLMEKDSLHYIKQEVKAEIDNIYNLYPIDFGPKTVSKGIYQVYKKCGNYMALSQRMLDDKTLHKLRKEIKYLLYQMQLCGEVWPSFFASYSSDLKTVADALGNDHNLVEAIKYIKEVPSDVLSPESKIILLDTFNYERQEIHQEIWPLVGKLFAEKPQAFVKRINSYWLIGRQVGA